MRRQGEDCRHVVEGALGYPRCHQRWYVYLARGCDELQVSLGKGFLGRDLHDRIRRAGDGARALPTMAKWQLPIKVRSAYGVAAGCHGGRSSDSRPEWSLTVAGFWPVRQEDFGDFVPASDHKREKHPRAFQTMALWSRCAD